MSSHAQVAAPWKHAPFHEDLNVTRIQDQGVGKELKHAIVVHNQTMASIKNFHLLYVNSQRERKDPPAHNHQDLLRAMLLFACSGLDAVIKQLINDAIETVLKHDEGAQREFRKFAERRLKKPVASEDRDRGNASASADMSFLAELLVSFDPRSTLVEALKRSLSSDSLQSRDQILKVASHFALTMNDVMVNAKVTKEAFDARNEIVHEMDIHLEGGNERRERDYETMVRWSENIADISSKFAVRVYYKVYPEREKEDKEGANIVDK